MKVALVIPRIDANNEKFGLDIDWGWWAPLGLLAVGTFLKKKNQEISLLILDEQVMCHEEMREALISYCPDWVGISPDYMTYENSLDLARLSKTINAQVVFGGHFASNYGQEMMKYRQEIDYVIIQDGEQAMDELINGKNRSSIKNLVWRSSDGVKMNEISFVNLDALPSIDYSLVNLDAYFSNYLKNQERRGIIDQPFLRPLTFSSQRGCRWREKSNGCLFCSCIYSRWRCRDPRSVWQDVIDARDEYGVDAMIFGEDDFLSSAEWFDSFYENRPKDRCPGIRFAYANACAINEKSAKQLAELGCYQLFVGFESGDDKCLRKLHKEASLGQGLNAARLLNKHGIKFNASFALGAPGETKDSLEKTYQLASRLKELGANGFNCYPLLPIPMSKAWKMALKKSKEFRDLHSKQDILEPEKLASLWITNFTLVAEEEVLLMCEKINGMFFHDWNFNHKNGILNKKEEV